MLLVTSEQTSGFVYAIYIYIEVNLVSYADLNGLAIKHETVILSILDLI